MPKKIDECVESVLDDNPEMDEPRAWAICNAEFNADVEVESLADTDLTGDMFAELAALDNDWTAVDGGWYNESESFAVYDSDAEQAEGFAVEVFQIVATDDLREEMDLQSDLMGIGVDFPNAGVYVDWNIAAWSDEDQLSGPHVSDYATIADLKSATGGEIVSLRTVEASDAE